jgi:hypothetical protein
MQSEPGSAIPGALLPGFADPGFPDSEQWGGWVTLDTPQVISGAKTFTSEVIIETGSDPGLLVSTDGTTTSLGAFLVTQADPNNPWFGIYDPNNSLYYGISRRLSSPSGTATVAGYYDGMGVGASVNTGSPVFGVLAAGQSGNGCGHVNFTIYGNGQVDTFSNVLDDGAGNMIVAGGVATAIRTLTSSAALTATDSVVLLNGTALTATLPSAAGIAGRAYTVKQTSASTGTVATSSSQTIDGASTVSLTQYKYVTVISDGSDWLITASN